jgi:hypothetical protein
MSQLSNPALTAFMLAIETGDLPGLGSEVRSSARPSAEIGQAVGALGLSGESAGLAKSAALLWHDHLDESHTVSQDLGSTDGSFLHGIMHRREPDYPNAKYWFRRVGDHPCFPALASAATEYLDAAGDEALAKRLAPGGQWDPFAFVDAVEAAVRYGNPSEIGLLQHVQRIEFETFAQTILA